MWTYRQPAFALQLLYELQKQQQGGLHCDTLLQTEGVSVPAHSCVLSALSPVLSRVLTNSPSLPVGHSRVLSVQAVGTNSLLKLVGFMYSGEMKGQGLVELEEVTDMAHRLGFSTLINGLKELMKGQKDKEMRWREIGLQTENAEERKKADASVQHRSDGRSFMHSESQTDSTEVCFTDTRPVPGSAGLSGELASVQSDTTTTISSDSGLDWIKDTIPFSSGGEASVSLNSIQKEHKSGNVPEDIDHLKTIHCKQKLNVKLVQTELNSGVLKSIKRVGGKDYRKLVQKLGFSSSTAFKKQGDTHLSLKIKLKRRRGALWEIDSVQEETAADGSSASGTSQASSRNTQSNTKNDTTCTRPHKNNPGVPLSPSSPNPRQALGTVTLTPPSDLTLSPPHTPVRNPSSSPLQIALLSPGVPQAEESDEHIARLLEDMVMMGLNILPSGPMDKKSDIHHLSEKCVSPELHLDPKMGQVESFGTEAAPSFCEDGQILAAGGHGVGKILSSSGSSAQGEAGSECPNSEDQFRCGTMDLKNVTSVASYPTSFGITKDADASLSTLPFSTGGLELPHQNVGELKNALDHLLWTAKDFVQSVKQTKSNTTSDNNVQSSGTATRSAAHSDLARLNTLIQTNSGSVNSAAVKQRLKGASRRDSKGLLEDSSNVKCQELSKQASGFIHGASSISNDGGMDLNEMRLPTCLSPLASKEKVTDVVSQKRTTLPCTVRLKQALKHQISFPQTEPLSGRTSKHSPCTPKAESVPGCSSRNLRSTQGIIKETSEGKTGRRQSPKKPVFGDTVGQKLTRQINKSGVSKSTKRYIVVASLDEPKKKTRKMLDCDSSGGNTQTVEMVTAFSTSGEAVDGIKSAKNSDPCTKKTYWLRPGKTIKSEQTEQQSKKKLTNLQTNPSCKSKDQDECTDVRKKESTVVKRGRGRAPKKGLQDNKSGHQDLQKVNQKHGEKEAQEAKVISEAISDVNLKMEEKKQPSRHASHAKSEGIVNQVFHQTIFSVGSSVTERLPSIDQKLQSSSLNVKIAQKTERKRGIGPALPHIVNKFRKLLDQDSMRRRRLISEKEENISTEKDQAEKVNNKSKDVKGKCLKDKNAQSENNSEHLRSSKNGTGCLVYEKEIGRNQMDTIFEPGNYSSDSSSANLKTIDLNDNLVSDLCTIPLTVNCGSNSKLEKIGNLQSATTKTCLQNTKTSHRTEDIPLKECERSANTQTVHQDVNQGCKKQQVKGNVEMGACVKENPKQSEEHEAEESDVDVEMMEESAPAAGCGNEAVSSGCSDGKNEIEKSQSSVEMINGVSVAHEAELRGPLCLRTELQIISSNEDHVAVMHTDSPATSAKEALSVQTSEQTYLSSYTCNSMDSSIPPVEHGLNTDTEDQECDDEEEVVVDDLLSSSPGILPHSLANVECMTVLTDGEEELEEEDVDVTGEDTD